MGDEHHGSSVVGKSAQHLQELVRLLRREHRRRLIENEGTRTPGERLDDFQPLLCTRREILDSLVRLNGQVRAAGDLSHALGGIACREPSPST